MENQVIELEKELNWPPVQYENIDKIKISFVQIFVDSLIKKQSRYLCQDFQFVGILNMS